jgi:hypothetical protein
LALVGTVGRAANDEIRTVSIHGMPASAVRGQRGSVVLRSGHGTVDRGWSGQFPGEGAALARVVLERFPAGAKVAVLRLDNATGAAYRQAFDAVLAGTPRRWSPSR